MVIKEEGVFLIGSFIIFKELFKVRYLILYLVDLFKKKE